MMTPRITAAEERNALERNAEIVQLKMRKATQIAAPTCWRYEEADGGKRVARKIDQ